MSNIEKLYFEKNIKMSLTIWCPVQKKVNFDLEQLIT